MLSDFIFKILVLGDPGVGKTSIIRRFVEDYFEEDYKYTIGVDFLEKSINFGNRTATLSLWDVAGQSKYAYFKKYYYSGANFVIVVFSVNDLRSYQNVSRWILGAAEILGPDVEFAILANKIDLIDQCVVQDYTDLKYNKKVFDFVETSAKTGKNVNAILKKVAEYLIRKTGSSYIRES